MHVACLVGWERDGARNAASPTLSPFMSASVGVGNDPAVDAPPEVRPGHVLVHDFTRDDYISYCRGMYRCRYVNDMYTV